MFLPPVTPRIIALGKKAVLLTANPNSTHPLAHYVDDRNIIVGTKLFSATQLLENSEKSPRNWNISTIWTTDVGPVDAIDIPASRTIEVSPPTMNEADSIGFRVRLRFILPDGAAWGLFRLPSKGSQNSQPGPSLEGSQQGPMNTRRVLIQPLRHLAAWAQPCTVWADAGLLEPNEPLVLGTSPVAHCLLAGVEFSEIKSQVTKTKENTFDTAAGFQEGEKSTSEPTGDGGPNASELAAEAGRNMVEVLGLMRNGGCVSPNTVNQDRGEVIAIVNPYPWLLFHGFGDSKDIDDLTGGLKDVGFDEIHFEVTRGFAYYQSEVTQPLAKDPGWEVNDPASRWVENTDVPTDFKAASNEHDLPLIPLICPNRHYHGVVKPFLVTEWTRKHLHLLARDADGNRIDNGHILCHGWPAILEQSERLWKEVGDLFGKDGLSLDFVRGVSLVGFGEPLQKAWEILHPTKALPVKPITNEEHEAVASLLEVVNARDEVTILEKWSSYKGGIESPNNLLEMVIENISKPRLCNNGEDVSHHEEEHEWRREESAHFEVEEWAELLVIRSLLTTQIIKHLLKATSIPPELLFARLLQRDLVRWHLVKNGFDILGWLQEGLFGRVGAFVEFVDGDDPQVLEPASLLPWVGAAKIGGVRLYGGIGWIGGGRRSEASMASRPGNPRIHDPHFTPNLRPNHLSTPDPTAIWQWGAILRDAGCAGFLVYEPHPALGNPILPLIVGGLKAVWE